MIIIITVTALVLINILGGFPPVASSGGPGAVVGKYEVQVLLAT